jgi:hypothetical protein
MTFLLGGGWRLVLGAPLHRPAILVAMRRILGLVCWLVGHRWSYDGARLGPVVRCRRCRAVSRS